MSSIINFSINDTLKSKIDFVIKEKGFESRSEFFRFCVMQYIDNECDEIIDEFKDVLSKIDVKKIPSLDEQLKGV